MTPDPQADRLRLVIESKEDETQAMRPEDDDESGRHRPDEMIDLDRLADEPDYVLEDEEEPPKRSKTLPAGLAVIALMGFGAVAWYAYDGVLGVPGPESIPLIVADAGPIKTRPTVPGGLEVPHQDKLVLNEITPDPNKPQVERLLPPPEVPKPPVVAAPQAPAQGEAGSEAVARAEPAPTPPAAGAVAQAPAAPSETAQGSEPAGTAAGQAEPVPLETASGPSLPAPKAAPQPPVTVAPAPKASAPPKAAAETASAAPAAAGTQAASGSTQQGAPVKTQSAALTGGYLIQLASLKDKNLAGREWVRLQAAYPDLLGSKKLVLQSADLGSRGTFHRVRAGYFENRAGAVALCQALKAKNQDCIVVKP